MPLRACQSNLGKACMQYLDRFVSWGAITLIAISAAIWVARHVFGIAFFANVLPVLCMLSLIVVILGFIASRRPREILPTAIPELDEEIDRMLKR